MTYDPNQPSWQPTPQQEAWQQGSEWAPPAPPTPPRRRSRVRLVVTLVTLGVVALGSYLIVDNRQYLSDQWTVWNFEVSSTLQGYIDRTQMTDHGEFLFLASTPVITGAEQFNEVCDNHEEGSGVLGCYRSGDKTITLFDITDERLDGKEEVVAAHEMLHAAWDRMTFDEQRDLTTRLEAAATALADDADFTARMAVYARLEPGQRVNELHSILGTEIAELSPELETYYAQYFRDRAALVQLHLTSNAVFVEIEAQSATLVAELDALREGMESDYADYNAGYDTLNIAIESFNARADAGEFTTQEQFDSERAGLIARQQALDALYLSIQERDALFTQKNAALAELNAQAAALNESLNIVPRSTESAG